jgi:hypothetical protein
MKHRRHLHLSAVVVPMLAITAILTACSSAPSAITTHGKVEVTVAPLDGTSTSNAYPDINPGSQVVVINSDNDTIATGTLSFQYSDTVQGDSDYYTFTVTVPGGLPRYGIEVGNGHGTLWESAAQMKAGPSLCLGDFC